MTASEFRDHADEFTKAYVEAALWSESADIHRCYDCDIDGILEETCPQCGCIALTGSDRSFTDLQLDIEDIHPDTLGQMVEDCRKFQRFAQGYILEGNLRFSVNCSAEQRAGHDFWLDRQGHGAGSHDGHWFKRTEEKLYETAKAFGGYDLYLGDDRKIHGPVTLSRFEREVRRAILTQEESNA